jgi:phosphoglycolate phosphatase-like HAD superfamily hydrolase
MKLPAFSSLQDFVRSGRPLSTDSLVEYNRTKADAFLAQVTEWSKRSDEQYARITRAEGNPPYPQVRPVLERAARVADIMIVSSSTHKALMQDWADTQLLALLSLVAGQEIGSKATQLEFAVKGNYEPHRTLMIGDAPGDLEAARSNHVMFYPIIPGQETQSWERFLDEGFDRFVRERYAGDYERRLLSEFENMLLSPERPLRA